MVSHRNAKMDETFDQIVPYPDPLRRSRVAFRCSFELVAKMADLLVQVSRGSDVFGRLRHGGR